MSASIILRDKIYIPATIVDEEQVELHYSHSLYNEKVCKRCPFKSIRHSENCDNCEAFTGKFTTYTTRRRPNGDLYFGIPLGAASDVEKKLGFKFKHYDIVDKRVKKKFDYNIKCSLEMREHQAKAVDIWTDMNRKYGLIIAPPRSGKTPMALYMAIKLGYRTLYIADQREYLTQFIEHIEKYTNLPRLQDKYGVPLYGFAKKKSDYETMQICVSTYHQFMQNSDSGVLRWEAARPHFSTLMIDEVDKTGAPEFARVCNSWPAICKTGFTGTDERKDGKHVVTRDVVGKVITRVEIPQMTPKIVVHVGDDVRSKSAYRGKAGFVYCCKFLAKHKKRNKEILKYIGRDLEKGHCIVLPVYHKDHMFDLVTAINAEYGAKTAYPFFGGTSKKDLAYREEVLYKAKRREIRVIVGIRSLLQRGLNVPAWSALYYTLPMNNQSNWKQESSRVLTPDDSGLKRPPLIRMFVDPHVKLSLSCFCNTFDHSQLFGHDVAPQSVERAKDMKRQLKNSHSNTLDLDPMEAGLF